MKRVLLAAVSFVACGDSTKPSVAPIVVAETPPSSATSSAAAPSSSPAASASAAPSASSASSAASAAPSSAPFAVSGDPPARGNMWGDAIGDGEGDAGSRLSLSNNAPSLRQGAVTVNGRLPPEVIQRIVRQNFGRFRLCYENALRTNPKLGGRLAVKFTITRAGGVTKVGDGGSELADANLMSCVTKGFANLSFPQPEGGEVTVVYPIIFAPGTKTP